MTPKQQMQKTDRSAATVIYRNGSVYSPVDPFATALLVQDGRIRWVGQEAGADSLTDAHVHTVDLDGLLLTPSFAAAGPVPEEEQGWLRLRRAGVHAVLDPQRGWADAAGQRSPLPARVRTLGPQGPLDPTQAERAEGDPLLVLAREDAPEPRGWIDVARAGLSAGRPLGVAGVLEPGTAPQPWRLTLAALRREEQGPGISTRGCFGLQTRGVRRVCGVGGPFGGQLVPEAPADLIGWRTEALMVQTADERIAAWSTDPRARTPLLPALGPDVPLPQARLSLVGASELTW